MKFGLVCLLHEHTLKYRTVTLAAAPDKAKLTDIYRHNAATLVAMLDFCTQKGIDGYRIPTNLFPLATHPKYQKLAQRIIFEDAQIQANCVLAHASDRIKTVHPDQFILLSSDRQDVNDRALVELNFWDALIPRLNIHVVNIHVGSRKLGAKYHTGVLAGNLDKLKPNIRTHLSLENEEKCYSALDVLKVCGRYDVLPCLDFHHSIVHDMIKHGHSLAQARTALPDYAIEFAAAWGSKSPVVHLSSPSVKYVDATLRTMCSHADYIRPVDFPHDALANMPPSTLIEVEAKHKQVAIAQLKDHLYDNYQLRCT